DRAHDLGVYSGRCVSADGWASGLTGTAALLAIGVALGASVLPPGVLVVAIAILLTTFGFQLREESGGGVHVELGSGAVIGFLSAVVLLALVIARSRPRTLEWSRLRVAVLPAAVCCVYVLAVGVP